MKKTLTFEFMPGDTVWFCNGLAVEDADGNVTVGFEQSNVNVIEIRKLSFVIYGLTNGCWFDAEHLGATEEEARQKLNAHTPVPCEHEWVNKHSGTEQCDKCNATREIPSSQCPEGGDITDDCAGCYYSCNYHFVNGDCMHRHCCSLCKHRPPEEIQNSGTFVCSRRPQSCGDLNSRDEYDCWEEPNECD